MKGKEIAIEKLFSMSIEEICKNNMKDTEVNKLMKIKRMDKNYLNNIEIRELASLLRTAWICPCTFNLNDLCMQVLSCVDCVEYSLNCEY